MQEDKKEKFIPIQFVPVHGTQFDTSYFKGSSLVLPTSSAGMSAMIAVDLFITNESVKKVGYLLSEYISPMVINDSLNLDTAAAPGQLTMPCEVYMSNDSKYTFILLRSGVCQGKMFPFGAVFTKFVEE